MTIKELMKRKRMHPALLTVAKSVVAMEKGILHRDRDKGDNYASVPTASQWLNIVELAQAALKEVSK